MSCAGWPLIGRQRWSSDPSQGEKNPNEPISRPDPPGWLRRSRHRSGDGLSGAACSASGHSSTASACRSGTTAIGGETYEPHKSVALANSGPLQIELIQTPERRPVHVPRLHRKRAIQGCSTWPTGQRAMKPTWSVSPPKGFTPVMSGEVGERGRFVYFDTHLSSRHGHRALRR